MRTLKTLFIILYVTAFQLAHATHNRAGEIYYTRIAPFTRFDGVNTVPVYRYAITVIKYADDGPQVANRCVDTVYFGDGDKGIAPRVNGSTVCSSNDCQTTIGGTLTTCGEIIINEPGYRVKKSVYTIIHEYPAAGTYLIRSFDRNRNAGVVNIPSSINQPFYIEALLVINSFSGANSSPIFNYAPIDRGCKGVCFEHNPGAYDPDMQDSLSFEIDVSRGEGGNMVPFYSFPATGGGYYGINPTTGLLRWCTPQAQGEYNLAFKVKEWRKNTSGTYELIGYVLRDMQVIIKTCPNNDPPVIVVPADTCVEAGTYVEKTILVTDANGGLVTLEGASGGFSANNPKATLSPTVGFTTPGPNGGMLSTFRWKTTCEHIRQQAYQNTFKAQDTGNGTSTLKLVSFNTYNIKVIPPSIKNVTAVPIGSTIKVTWDLSTCSPTSNPLTGYKIYRKNDCSNFSYNPCKGGIPLLSGYKLIGQTGLTTAFFIDNNNNDGLVVGQSYSYLVVAVYQDGTETYASSQVCSRLKRDVPVIVNVDVVSTSKTTGEVFVKWTLPLKTQGNFDTVAFKGPYIFNLKHQKSNGDYETVFTSTKPFLYQLDTFYNHKNLNTQDTSHNYFIEFISGTITVGNSQKANSVFLICTPNDRRIDLSWTTKTPWNNYMYTVQRKNPNSSTFSSIATTTLSSYTDSNNVVNKATYCYKIISEGRYSDSTIVHPLINRSQENCATAKDLTSPCTPTISMDADCPSGFVKVSWTNVEKICNNSDDVLNYRLFFKSEVNGEYSLVATLTHTTVNEYIFDGLTLISGCYAIQAVDSNNNISQISPDFCVDNCPEFELPNIFTPDGDSRNDFFKAIKVRQIKEIDLNVFDRWGTLVYKTKDPYFKWDGISTVSKQPVSDGVFFYTCDVYEPRLKGIVKRNLKGSLHIIR